jgi:hypothetical protein
MQIVRPNYPPEPLLLRAIAKQALASPRELFDGLLHGTQLSSTPGGKAATLDVLLAFLLCYIGRNRGRGPLSVRAFLTLVEGAKKHLPLPSWADTTYLAFSTAIEHRVALDTFVKSEAVGVCCSLVLADHPRRQ